MTTITWTEEDIKRGTLVDPSWYLAEIVDMFDKISKAGDSTNTVVDFKIISNEGGDTKFAGVPVRIWLSEKAPGLWKGFLSAFGIAMNPKGGSFDPQPDRFKGKRLYIMVTNEPFEGRMTNKVADYRPVSA
jgi:hypothetical protein